MMTHHTDQVVGTIGGTLLAVSAIPTGTAVISTIILACIGATIGFLTTLVLKNIYNYCKKKKNENS